MVFRTVALYTRGQDGRITEKDHAGTSRKELNEVSSRSAGVISETYVRV